MAPFLITVVDLFADRAAEKLFVRLDAYFQKLESMNKLNLEQSIKVKELKEDIKLAITKEERDVLLDKMFDLLPTAFK